MSPRVPTVEYARSERSSAKSSQAAWNSALSRALSSALRRRQAGSSLKNVNLTNVRPATRRRLVAAVLAAGALLCVWAAPAAATPSVTVAVLPAGTTVEDLTRVPGMSPGVLSAGIGSVSAEQTFLDVSQGNRVSEALYDGSLPQTPRGVAQVPGWSRIVARAESAPADLVPGLLASTLRQAGVPVSAEEELGPPALIAAGRSGTVTRVPVGRCPRRRCPGLSVVATTLAGLDALRARELGDDLLIALAAAPPPEHGALAIGIAGRGFDGDLISDSTRTDGYVLSTDLAPTILARFGLRAPEESNGEPIRTEGTVDPAAIANRAERMQAIPGRRVPVLAGCLAAWIVVAAAAALLFPGLRRRAAAWLALSIAYLPLVLLAGAALQPGAVTEGLLTGFGAGAFAALTLRLAVGWWAAAIAAGATTLVCAIDVIAGSGLTKLSLLGPNPIYGARFYGIGNELEALIAVLVPAAVGAALTASGERGRPRVSAPGAFLATGFLAGFVFGAGRFGADVGAAIVLPLGGAVAAASLSSWGGRGRLAVAVVSAPLTALVLLLLIDLASGGNAHLTRSVIDAGGAGDLADAAQRRLVLSAHDFADAARTPLFWLVVAVLLAGIARRRAIASWFAGAPPARGALLGSCAAVGVGVLVNDSGASFLVIGTIALAALVAFGWSQMQRAEQAGGVTHRTQSGKWQDS